METGESTIFFSLWFEQLTEEEKVSQVNAENGHLTHPCVVLLLISTSMRFLIRERKRLKQKERERERERKRERERCSVRYTHSAYALPL